MNTSDTTKLVDINPDELAHMGEGVVAYIREIEGKEAIKLLGDEVKVAPDARLFCLYQADGTPISISGSHEAAVGSAMEHELMPMSVH